MTTDNSGLAEGGVGINLDHPVYRGGTNPHKMEGGVPGFVGSPSGGPAQKHDTKFPEPKLSMSDAKRMGRTSIADARQNGPFAQPESSGPGYGGMLKSQNANVAAQIRSGAGTTDNPVITSSGMVMPDDAQRIAADYDKNNPPAGSNMVGDEETKSH